MGLFFANFLKIDAVIEYNPGVTDNEAYSFHLILHPWYCFENVANQAIVMSGISSVK
jgi:hypothetical protein